MGFGMINKGVHRTRIPDINTYIGGLGAVVTTASELENILGSGAGSVVAFNLIGNDIEAAIKTTYILKYEAFNNNSYITYFNDAGKLVSSIEENSFRNADNLVYVIYGDQTTLLVGKTYSFYSCAKLESLTTAGYSIIEEGFFRNSTKISINDIDVSQVVSIANLAFRNSKGGGNLDLPLCLSIGNSAFHTARIIGSVNLPLCASLGTYAFYSNTYITSFSAPLLKTISTYTFRYLRVVNLSLPELTTVNGTYAFSDMEYTNSIYIPKCTTLGSDTGDNNVFSNLKIGCTITVSSILETIDNGNPDGDLVYARDSRGATIIYV